jgi:hypothetical protein
MVTGSVSATTPAIERITPSGAAVLLEANGRNRNMRMHHVAQLADAMKRGEWEVNGETIKIALDGTLIDGQHRLQAVVESGVSIDTIVMRELPRSAQDTVDTGRRRRLADVLAIEGYSDTHALAAALTHLHRYVEGRRIDSHSDSPSVQQALDLLRERPEISESIASARKVTKSVGGPIGVFSALHCVFAEVDSDKGHEFFERLADGANLALGDPVLHLRNQLARPRQDRNFSQSPYVVAALTIKAFNLRRADRKIDVLSFRANERFPTIDPPPYSSGADG